MNWLIKVATATRRLCAAAHRPWRNYAFARTSVREESWTWLDDYRNWSWSVHHDFPIQMPGGVAQYGHYDRQSNK
jgi:hypothetical protein